MNYIPLSQRKGRVPVDNRGIESIMEDIARVESGGKYDALGPTVEKGQYAGEQALGKYQIMPGNIPSWSKEALGYEVSPEEFLANPELQDSIAKYKMDQAYKKYGNAEDVASVWFTGRPKSQAGGKVADVTGTTNDEYIRRVTGGSGMESARRYIPISQRS